MTIRFWKDVLHRALQHGHEITAIIVAEGARSSIIFVALLIALILVAFAVQQLFHLET